jgi:hypothetical protein
LNEVPLANRYNMDEEGKDSNKGRTRVVVESRKKQETGETQKKEKTNNTKKKKKQEKTTVDRPEAEANRIYERTDGDHAPFHVTNVQVGSSL